MGQQSFFKEKKTRPEKEQFAEREERRGKSIMWGRNKKEGHGLQSTRASGRRAKRTLGTSRKGHSVGMVLRARREEGEETAGQGLEGRQGKMQGPLGRGEGIGPERVSLGGK